MFQEYRVKEIVLNRRTVTGRM